MNQQTRLQELIKEMVEINERNPQPTTLVMIHCRLQMILQDLMELIYKYEEKRPTK